MRTQTAKVLNVCLSDGRGGIQNAFANYDTALRSIFSDVLSLCPPSLANKATTRPHWKTLEAKFEFDPLAILRLAIYLLRMQPDLCICHGRRALRIVSTAKRLFRSQTKIVCVLHRHRFKGLADADLVLTVTQTLAEEAKRNTNSAIPVAHLPNFIVDWPSTSPRKAGDGETVIGFLGRLSNEKGLDLLLEAVWLLRSKGYKIKLCIAGDGPDAPMLQRLQIKYRLSDVTTWLGWVEGPSALLSRIDILCVPSRSESFGLVILEAFAAGVPVIATKTVGAKELIRDCENGMLCEISSYSIADALADLVEDSYTQSYLSTNAAVTAKLHSLPLMVPQLRAALAVVLPQLERRFLSEKSNSSSPEVANVHCAGEAGNP